jgi:hypothetical protein
MDYSKIILLPNAIKEHKPRDMWKTPVRSIIRGIC